MSHKWVEQPARDRLFSELTDPSRKDYRALHVTAIACFASISYFVFRKLADPLVLLGASEMNRLEGAAVKVPCKHALVFSTVESSTRAAAAVCS
jgi:hypothetical protein